MTQEHIAPDYTELRERLNAVEGNRPDSLGICTMWHRNPDGPEASTAIAELQAQVAALRAALERCGKIVERNLYCQHEKIEDVPRIECAALQPKDQSK